jgi:CobQ-like glutamine amidotransferase family enzyme
MPDGTLLTGFENHGGRTRLGPAAEPLASVLRGHGNNGDDGTEGVRSGNLLATYLHGPVLARNPELADSIAMVLLKRRGEAARLEPIVSDPGQVLHDARLRAAGCDPPEGRGIPAWHHRRLEPRRRNRPRGLRRRRTGA